jgi:hypothetical protein
MDAAMIRTRRPPVVATMLVALVAVPGCRHHAVTSTSLVPRTCAEPAWGPTTTAETTPAHPDTTVGITFAPGRGAYVVDDAFVEILRPGAVLDPDTKILGHENPAVAAADARDFGPGTRTVAATFTGKDASGAPLPAGDYPVVFAFSSHPTHCGGSGTGQATSGVITTLDWKG